MLRYHYRSGRPLDKLMQYSNLSIEIKPKKSIVQDYRFYLLQKMMHLVHDIPTFVNQQKGYINVVVDVPKGSNNKYEYDHDL